MNAFARRVGTVTTLGLALLLAGCATTQTAQRPRHERRDFDLRVVESSSDRSLSAEDMALLRKTVARFLAEQGLMEYGEYLVRIEFPPETPDAPAEWMVVKLIDLPEPMYSVVAAYPGFRNGYVDPYDLRYGLWDWTYGYYYDPFDYYSGVFFPPAPTGPRHPGIPGGGYHRPGDKDNHPGGTHARNDGRKDGDGRRDADGKRDWAGRRDGNDRHGDGRHESDNRTRTADYVPRTGNSSRPHDYSSSGTTQAANDRSSGGSYSPPARSDPAPRQESYSPPSSPVVSSNAGIQVSSTEAKEK